MSKLIQFLIENPALPGTIGAFLVLGITSVVLCADEYAVHVRHRPYRRLRRHARRRRP